MYQLILKDKNFEIEKILSFLNQNNLSFQNFKENFGEIYSCENLDRLYNLKNKLKDYGIDTIIAKKQNYSLPHYKSIKSIELKGEKLFFTSDFKFSINLKSMKILALGIIKKKILHYNPFFKNEKNEIPQIIEANQTTKDVDFFLEIFLEKTPYRLKLKSDEITYLSPFKIDSGSFLNFKNMICTLKKFSHFATTNKTLDLFLSNKNIEYFIYEDYLYFEKELIWLKKAYGEF